MLSFASIALILVVSLPQLACASRGFVRGNDLSAVQVSDLVSQVKPGTIVVLGENHGFKNHQAQHLAILQALRAQNHKISVGLEFFYYPDQAAVEQYHRGDLAEEEFLKLIKWGSPNFSYYRDQALFPRFSEGESLVALNAPRTLTSALARGGLEGLTADQKALLPPQFSPGSAAYRERFLELMPHLPNPEAGERYFLAQSAWDDTMAWRAVEFMKTQPDHVLVIVVGEFHVAYGGGLQDRIKARGHQEVLSLSQINTSGLSSAEIQEQVSPHPKYGPRADFVWFEEARP